MLNNYFASQSVVNDNNKPLPSNTTVSHEHLELTPFTVQDVKDVFDQLHIQKACGPDLLNPRLLKEGSSILALPYSIIFNRSIQAGHFPSPWKDVKLTPIYKKELLQPTIGQSLVFANLENVWNVVCTSNYTIMFRKTTSLHPSNPALLLGTQPLFN